MSGASGAIGLACVQALVRAGHDVRAFVRSGSSFLDLSWERRVELMEGDALDPTSVAAALEGTDAVFHCVSFPVSHYTQHIDALLNVLDLAAENCHVIYPGSLWVYGPPQMDRIGPDHPKESPAKLGAIRADLEAAVLEAGGTVVHLPAVYGPSVRSGYLRWVFERALAGRTVYYPSGLGRAIELMYVGDAARALLAALGKERARGSDYTAPGHSVISPDEFISLLFKAAGQPLRKRALPVRFARTLASLHPQYRALRDLAYILDPPPLLDGALIRRELGWVPETDYAEGIRRTVRWLRRSPAADHADERARSERRGRADFPEPADSAPA